MKSRASSLPTSGFLPTFEGQAFHCPFCALANSDGRSCAERRTRRIFLPSEIHECTCGNCIEHSWWRTPLGRSPVMLYPTDSSAPPPHPEMPEDVLPDYEEAANIVAESPRDATALLRLGLQKLMVDLGQSGKNINGDIAALVKSGLAVEVQQALDALRVIGNNAVHPGELDLRDDVETAIALFGLINFIVEQRISQPNRLKAMYMTLPQAARDAIEKRDA